MVLLSKPWAADAHDAGFGWLCCPSRGQLMFMMLASVGLLSKTWAADAHDAGFGRLWAALLSKPWAADAHDAGFG